MIDGLRLDTSRRLPVLERLRADGEDVAARAEFPTFSGPNFVAQASGIEPTASGVFSNDYSDEVALDSVFRQAKLAGLRTAVVTTEYDSDFGETYGSWIDETSIHDPGVHVPDAELVFFHIGFVDRAGHEFGAASREYDTAARRADEMLGRIARSVDPVQHALVVTSDHGHIAAGGHGGTERDVVRIPIVMWGAGVAHGTRAGRGRDVGPTIASLLGIGPLVHATGRPLVAHDVRAARQRDVARAAVDAQGPHRGRVPLALPLVAVALLVLGATSGVETRSLVSAPTYAVVFAVLLLATNTLSFSVANDTGPFAARLTVLAAVAGIAQLRVGGRSSLVPAAFVAAVAALSAVAAAHATGVSMRGTLSFLPIPALAGVAFICLVTALAGRRYALAARGPETRESPPAPAVDPTGMLPGVRAPAID
jgi:hypothetical protein